MNELFENSQFNIHYYSEPADVDFDGTSICIMPWINNSNLKDSLQFIKDTKSQILFGHLELKGFEMYKGSVNEHGLSQDIFDKFDLVGSGHFHTRSTKGNINYLGAPYEMTWSDFDDPRGFHIFDTDTRELTYIQNPYTIFEKYYYNDSNRSGEELIEKVDFNIFKNKFVKLIIENKQNDFWFEKFVDKVEEHGPYDLQILDDFMKLLEDNDVEIDEAEDTISILQKVVESLDTNIDKNKINSFLAEIYNEALAIE